MCVCVSGSHERSGEGFPECVLQTCAVQDIQVCHAVSVTRSYSEDDVANGRKLISQNLTEHKLTGQKLTGHKLTRLKLTGHEFSGLTYQISAHQT